MSKGLTLLGADTQKGIWKVLKGQASLDFAAITAPNDEDLTISVPGARLGDPVLVASSATLPAGAVLTAFVSATDVVTVRLTGNENIANPDAQTVTVFVFHEQEA